MPEEHQVLLEMRNLTKAFPDLVAVNNVSFNIYKGEVHIIIGENGAGKSTLVEMIAGLKAVTSGQMMLDGEEYRPANVLDAREKGVNIVHQELNMMLNRTVAQNLFVGREPVRNRLGIVDTRRMNRECRELLEGLGLDIDPATPVKELSIAQQQMIEVAKAVSINNKLLIMDEPTSSLTQKEIDNLFKITRKLKERGVGIIYISHRMQELMEIGDRVTVMRDGCYIGTKLANELDMQELISMMVGRKIVNLYDRSYNTPGGEVIRTEDLTGLRFRNVSVNVKRGEIVGLAGLVGAGRTEFAKSLFGYDKITGGKIYIEGGEVRRKGYDCGKAIGLSMSFLPENRKTEGLFLDLSIKENVVEASLRFLFPKGVVNHKTIDGEAEKAIKELKIVTSSSENAVVHLSGGNQQKVVIAKWLVKKSKLFIFDEPTRGIDVGAKAEIYSLMNSLAKEGAGILMISSDLPELLGLADRVYVMKDGEISGEITRNDLSFTQEKILSLAI